MLSRKSVKFIGAAVVVAALAGCASAGVGRITQVIDTSALLAAGTFVQPGTPITVRGAEVVGLTPDQLAGALRFPPSQNFGSFVAVPDGRIRGDHAHISLRQRGQGVTAFLQFLHGSKEIGAGTFSMNVAEFQNPASIGNASATLINDMIRQARIDRIDSDRGGSFRRKIKHR